MTSIWILLMAVTIQSFTFAVSVFSWDNGFFSLGGGSRYFIC